MAKAISKTPAAGLAKGKTRAKVAKVIEDLRTTSSITLPKKRYWREILMAASMFMFGGTMVYSLSTLKTVPQILGSQVSKEIDELRKDAVPLAPSPLVTLEAGETPTAMDGNTSTKVQMIPLVLAPKILAEKMAIVPPKVVAKTKLSPPPVTKSAKKQALKAPSPKAKKMVQAPKLKLKKATAQVPSKALSKPVKKAKPSALKAKAKTSQKVAAVKAP